MLYYLYVYIIFHILCFLHCLSLIHIYLNIMYNNNCHKNNYIIYNMLNVHDNIFHYLLHYLYYYSPHFMVQINFS